MNALISFLLLFFAIIFWGFRVIVCLMNSMQLEFFAVPYNSGFEIAMLFVSVLCFVLIVKRNLIGATIYLGLAFAYFGSSLYERFVAGADLSIISGSYTLIPTSCSNKSIAESKRYLYSGESLEIVGAIIGNN